MDDFRLKCKDSNFNWKLLAEENALEVQQLQRRSVRWFLFVGNMGKRQFAEERSGHISKDKLQALLENKLALELEV
jgi:hypothetical protein